MTLGRFLCAATLALFSAIPAIAHTTGGMQVKDAYATATPSAGAVYFRVENHTPGDDRVIAVSADVAGKVEMHTSKADSAGVMKMAPIEGGVSVPLGSKHSFAPGGDHVMLMDLTRKLSPGDSFPLTVTFETFGPVTVEVHVVKPGEGAPAHEHEHSDGHADHSENAAHAEKAAHGSKSETSN